MLDVSPENPVLLEKIEECAVLTLDEAERDIAGTGEPDQNALDNEDRAHAIILAAERNANDGQAREENNKEGEPKKEEGFFHLSRSLGNSLSSSALLVGSLGSGSPVRRAFCICADLPAAKIFLKGVPGLGRGRGRFIPLPRRDHARFRSPRGPSRRAPVPQESPRQRRSGRRS